MAGSDPSRSLLSAAVGYQAEDWATFGASAALDLRGAAERRRAINQELGVTAAVQLDASGDLQGEAHATARIGAHVRLPLDLITECGVVEAAGVTLELGPPIGDFIALTEQDPNGGGATTPAAGHPR